VLAVNDEQSEPRNDELAVIGRHRLVSMATKVPEITVMFWVLKLLSTGMGEVMSDFLGDKTEPFAVAIGVGGLVLALWLQLRQGRYRAPFYWFVVMMVAIFGTEIADEIHIGAGVPYAITTPVFALIVGAIFFFWYRSEGTLSIHSITTRRRECFYWAAVLATFALGTAAGDLVATPLNLGYWPAALLFAALIMIPAVGWRRYGLNPIAAFWFAYIITRPIGASMADGLSKNEGGGLALGDGTVAGIALVVFIALVAYVTVTKSDIQDVSRAEHLHPHPEPHMMELATEPE
jgi:uncharacterized membrane-anchored protein